MCRPDIALITYDWRDDKPNPWPNFEVEHECVNWNSLQEWASQNSFTLGGGIVSHPIYGKEFIGSWQEDWLIEIYRCAQRLGMKRESTTYHTNSRFYGKWRRDLESRRSRYRVMIEHGRQE